MQLIDLFTSESDVRSPEPPEHLERPIKSRLIEVKRGAVRELRNPQAAAAADTVEKTPRRVSTSKSTWRANKKASIRADNVAVRV